MVCLCARLLGKEVEGLRTVSEALGGRRPT